MLKRHEILGTDLPIYSTKKEDHTYLEELTNLNENIEWYEIVAYIQTELDGESFFEPVYSKKEKSSDREVK
jgi:hypothetical protein